MFKDKITKEIDNLLVYSFFLPEETKTEFINDIDKIKEEIILTIENYLETLNKTTSSIPAPTTVIEKVADDLEAGRVSAPAKVFTPPVIVTDAPVKVFTPPVIVAEIPAKEGGNVSTPVKDFTPPVIVKEEKKTKNNSRLEKETNLKKSTAENLKTETNPDNVANIFNYIIPNFSFESRVLLSMSNSQNLSKLVNIMDEQTSLLKIYDNHKGDFKNSKFEFLKLIHKLDSQDLLTYKTSDDLNEKVARVKFGELAVNLGLVNKEQVEETFVYKQKNPDKKLFIGDSLVEMNYMDIDTLQYCLKIQDWCNKILTKVSNENAYIDAVREVLENYFKIPAIPGKFSNITYEESLTKSILITYQFTGKLNGRIFYICDRSLIEKLTKILMLNYGMSPDDVDKIVLEEKILLKLFNLITGNSLAKLTKIGIHCKFELPKIDMSDEINISDNNTISTLPISTEFGRFIIGFQLS